jgi:L-aminopeptidase/D-esterase-like protein
MSLLWLQRCPFCGSSGNTTILATDGGKGAPAVTAGDAGFFALDTSSFANAASNATSTSNGYFALELISAAGGSGQLDVVYNATPEPGTTLLVVASAAPLLMRRRRRVNCNSSTPS